MANSEYKLASVLAVALTEQTQLQDIPTTIDHVSEAALWNMLVSLACRHGLGEYLLWVAGRQGSSKLPQDVELELKLLRNRTTLQYWLIMQTVAQITAALAEVGIPCIWIKGVALASTVYPNPELRPMFDADVLVPFEKRKAALRVAEKFGYRMLNPQLFDGSEGIKHHYFLRGNKQDSVNLEIHFRLLGMADTFLPVEHQQWFWQNSVEWSAGDRIYQTLAPEAHVLYLGAHALLQHGEAEFHLQRYLDLHLLISGADSFNWQKLIEQAVTLGWTYCTARALEITTTYFGTAIPENVGKDLARRRPAYEDIRHVTRRQEVRPNAKHVLDELAAMSTFARIKAFCRIVFPPATYMQWRYGRSEQRLPAIYAKRIGHMIGDLAALLRKRESAS